jgi:hypothetical protein
MIERDTEIMNDWISRWPSQMENIVAEAAERVEFSVRPMQGFDGDSWTWVWSEDGENENTVAEVYFRAAPELSDQSVHVEVSSAARIEGKRGRAWVRRPWSDNVNMYAIDPTIDQYYEHEKEHHEFIMNLESHLNEFREKALSASSNLE